MSTTRKTLLGLLKDGPRKLDDVLRDLARSGKLGFGVEPEDVWSAALVAGDVVGYNDGQKTWARIGAPFVQLRRGNDWGSVYFAVQPLDDRGMASARRGITSVEGQVIEIKWPDGSISQERITHCVIFSRVSDHGTVSDVQSTIPGVEINHRGVKTWIPLDTEGVRVRSDAFA